MNILGVTVVRQLVVVARNAFTVLIQSGPSRASCAVSRRSSSIVEASYYAIRGMAAMVPVVATAIVAMALRRRRMPDRQCLYDRGARNSLGDLV